MPDTIRWTGAVDGDADTAGNYSPAQVPVTGDTLIFERNAVDVDASLDALAAVTLAALHIRQSYTGLIGTAAAYLEVSATVGRIGEHFGPGVAPAGSQRIMLDLKAAQATVTVLNSARSSPSGETSLPPIRLLGTHASNALYVRRGRVGVACVAPTEVSTFVTIDLAHAGNVDSDADVLLGPTVTWTTINKTGGQLVIQSAGTTLTQEAGSVLTEGAGAITTVNLRGGSAMLNSTGTITTLNADGGIADLLRSNAARTITTLAAARDSTGIVRYDPAVVTVTNKLAPVGPTQISLAPAA